MFEWPCPRREAHGAHPVRRYRRDDKEIMHLVDDTCPGVKAHPDTMIGRTS